MLPVFLTAFVPYIPAEAAWLVAAPAVAVGFLLYRLTLRVVRESRERARQQALYEVREMLTDRVRNRLAILSLALPSDRNASPDETTDDAAEGVDPQACIRSIETLVDGVSEETLLAWKTHYAGSRALGRAALRS